MPVSAVVEVHVRTGYRPQPPQREGVCTGWVRPTGAGSARRHADAMDDLSRLLRRQDGLVSRRQVVELGGDDLLVERRLRRREWARVHDGVYVDHTGPLSHRQREWAALLRYPGTVLAGRCALAAAGAGAQQGAQPVELAAPHGRRVAGGRGVAVVQVRRFAEVALAGATPPRLRPEHAALLWASSARDEDRAVGTLCDVVREEVTTQARLAAALETHPRLPRRGLLRRVLDDVAVGVESPLERRYLRDVERAHGLPHGQRQVREVVELLAGKPVRFVRRDVRYRDHAALVELDGRLGHTAAADRWSDLDRDLEAATRGDVTLRAGWRQVLEPCRLALVVGRVLSSRGWTGAPRPCRSPACVLGSRRAA